MIELSRRDYAQMYGPTTGDRVRLGDTSLLIRMLEVDRGVSFLPWYAVESGVQQGRLIRLSVEDCYISLYRQIFCHKEKWRTREMDEFVRVAKLADE